LNRRRESLLRAEMVAVGAALVRSGLIRGREGNLSCRLADGAILLTPRGRDKGRLAGPELVRCEPGLPPPPAASSEAKAHLAVYRACPDVLALVHAHPAAVLTLSALGRLPSPTLLKEGNLLVPHIEAVAALPPGSQELAEACASAIRRAPAAVLRQHGALCAGADLWQALDRVEALELLARIELGLGGSGGSS